MGKGEEVDKAKLELESLGLKVLKHKEKGVKDGLLFETPSRNFNIPLLRHGICRGFENGILQTQGSKPS